MAFPVPPVLDGKLRFTPKASPHLLKHVAVVLLDGLQLHVLPFQLGREHGNLEDRAEEARGGQPRRARDEKHSRTSVRALTPVTSENKKERDEMESISPNGRLVSPNRFGARRAFSRHGREVLTKYTHACDTSPKKSTLLL